MSKRRLNTFVHHAKLNEHGELEYQNVNYFLGMLKTFYPCDVRITVERKKQKRTQAQNRYLWGVVYDIFAQETGYTPEEIHQVMSSKFLRKKNVWRGGEITTLRSTTELTSDEFSEYIMAVIMEASDMGITIPEADKDYYVKEQFNVQ